MPELPEVETIVRDIRPALVGRQLGRVSLSHDDILSGVTRRTLLRGLNGATVHSVFRRAKHAVLDLGARRLVVQPGMTGSLIVYDRPLTAEERRYAVLRAPLDDGRELVYRDVRRIGKLRLLDAAGWRRYTEAIGPEPLDPDFTADRLGSAPGSSRPMTIAGYTRRSGGSWRRPSRPTARPSRTTAPAPASPALSSWSCWSTGARESRAVAAARGSPART
jgi:formamidopyrimidine-DNA glycosylase